MTGLRILNGSVCEDADIGNFTFVNLQGSSTIDFVLCKPCLFPLVSSFMILEPNILSDHCVFSFSLKQTNRSVLKVFLARFLANR